MHFLAPVPILRSFSEQQAKSFYIDFLEFDLDWEHRLGQNAPLYAQISKGNCIIHLSEHYGDASPGTTLRVEIENLTQYQNLLSAKQFKHARPGTNEMPWGLEMPISDPFGNKLIFTQTS